MKKRRSSRLARLAYLRENLTAGAQYVIVGGGIMLLLAMVLIYGTTGALPFGSGDERTAEERRQLLSAGDCALYRNGQLAGRITGVGGPSRGNPNRTYQVSLLERRQGRSINAREVTVVPCTSIETEAARR